MWTQKAPNGKIQYCERYWYLGKRRVFSVTFDHDSARNRKEAIRMLQEKVCTKKRMDSALMSVVIDDYIRHQKETLRSTAYIRNERTLKKVCYHLKDPRINSIDAGYYMECLPKEHFNERLVRFKAFIRWAYRNDYVEDCSYLDKLKPYPKNKAGNQYLERDELAALLDGMAVEKWRDVTLILALSGLRIGELQALEKGSISLSERVLHIKATIDRELDEIAYRTKTDTSTRDVYIQDELLPLIEKYMQEDGALLIDFDYDAYRKYLHENSERILGKKIHPHALRHTMTSLFAENGIPLEVISRRLGHADSAITKKIYFHVTEKLKEKDAEMIKGIRII